MAAHLLERDQHVQVLDEALRQAAAGHGRVTVVSGEAGIGKTSLVEHFLDQCQPMPRARWGACEALFTPRPLGPLYDIAQQTQAPLRALLDGEANRATLFAAVFDDLAQGPVPAVVVIEDIHWADEATLDLIKYLARRIHRLPALLILTYRDDELSRDHPLRLVLGDLPARDVCRLRLAPLSEAAVAVLARQANRRAGELYRATGGNPFFLREALASDAPGVPPSVSDAVLAQVARRSAEAQLLLELVAVVPTRVEWEVVEAVSAAGAVAYGAGLEECLAAGMLHQEGSAVGYRHELARQAVEDALVPARRRILHGEVLRVLLERGDEQTSLARLVHHAMQAEESAQVLRFAPEAARQASAQGAHREAAAYYRHALAYADMLPAAQRAEVLDGLSNECSLIGQTEEAVQTVMAELAIWRALDHSERVGHALRRLSRLSWHQGRNAEAERYGTAAVELLETLPPGHELAMAYANISQLRMVVSDTAQTVLWGGRAIELAERLDDDETMCYALITVGACVYCAGDEGGRSKLERGLQLALDHGHEEQVARAYVNLIDIELKHRDHMRAEGYIRDGMAYCAEHDLDSWSQELRLGWASVRLDQGDWAGAAEEAAAVLGVPSAAAVSRIPALIVLGLVRARRGDPGAEAVLDEARDLALATGEMQCIAPMAAARAEWRWLQGKPMQCMVEARVGVEVAVGLERPWYVGEVAIWLWRGGGGCPASEELAAPYALQVAGDWRAAAALWERLGCPYEQALALLNGDETAQRAALALFERLGAAPAAEIARQRLRDAGARGLPRGPRPATQANPQSLTNRQLEVLRLLAEGLRNPEIAARLSTTPKTVEHHVSAVLAKLEARSRAEAVRAAYQLGLIPQTAETVPSGKIGV
jgi:DNA-binding CsgD family transcriptional regulator/tetratricopeptide (TPR) repeat protein